MKIHLESTQSANKKLGEAIVDLHKQSTIHRPENYYLPPDLYRAAINSAARDAKEGKIEVEIFFKGVPVKSLKA